MSEKYFHFLRNIRFFKELKDEDIRNIAGYCSDVTFSGEKILFYEGDPADKFYIVMNGEVEIWKSFDTEDADMLAIHGEGHLFGEMAIIDRMPRSATARARGKVNLLQIKENDFQRMVREKTSVAFSIIRSLSSMVRKSNETFLEDLKARNTELEKSNNELKEAQEELIKQERLSNLGKFSSMILHDLRNPISVIKAYAQLLEKDTSLSEKTGTYISNISFEIERLNSLANELLDYSRGDIRLNLSIVTIDDLFSHLEASIKRRFSGKNISLKLENHCKDPVLFDNDRIIRVMMNLAENARKAIHKAGCICISAVKEDSFLKFIIEDDGEGMTEDTQKHIFEPFYSSSKSGGTGLGMVIVRNVINAHEGDMEIRSSPGKGTKITISLPSN